MGETCHDRAGDLAPDRDPNEPGDRTMWYSLIPGNYLFDIGQALAFRVGTISVTGQ